MVVIHCYVSDEKTGLLSIISALCKEESILECKKCTCLFGMEKYDVFYWTKIVWNWLQHRVIMINHDISWYITKYQIISDNIRQYHDISRFITIYHDISWFISEILTLKMDIALRKWHKSAITSRFIMIMIW